MGLKASISGLIAVTALYGPQALARAIPYPTVPEELIGVWSENDDMGRVQCDAYRMDPVRRDSDGYDPLVGSVVISPALIHSYAEYGEGNFYKVTDVEATGPQSWSITSDLSLDTMPDDGSDGGPSPEGEEQPIKIKDGFRLDGKILTWTRNPVWEGEKPRPRMLFRCGDLK